MISVSFKPSLIPTIITLLLLPLFIMLGFWQLHRAQEKKIIMRQLEQRLQQPAITIKDLPQDTQQWQYLSIKARGYYDNKHQFLLDNKIYHGSVGYEVITPFVAEQSNRILLINRGWIPAPINRKQLPDILPVNPLQEISGTIKIPLGKTLTLKSEQLLMQAWPKRLQEIDFDQMQNALGKKVYPFLILLNANCANGFIRQWQFINMQPQKHIIYAVQWFAFAVLLLVLFIGLNIQRHQVTQ